MKILPLARLLAFGILCPAATASAQNFTDTRPAPVARKAEAAISENSPLCVVKNSPELDSRINTAVDMTAIIDVDVLREPSIYKNGTKHLFSGAEENLKASLTLLAATYRQSAKPAGSEDSYEIALSVRQKIKIDPSMVLEIAGDEIAANPSCACEIVRAAIQVTDADTPLVISIVDTAIHAAPESMRMISQCAIASAPESLAAIQALLAELDPNGGESGPSSKSAKSAKNGIKAVVSNTKNTTTPNPLDLPPLYPIPPGPIMPPLVTNVNP